MQFNMNDGEIKQLLNARLLLLHLPLPLLLPLHVAFALAHRLFKILLISLLLQGPVDALKSATIGPLTLLSAVGVNPCPHNLPVCSLCDHELLRDR